MNDIFVNFFLFHRPAASDPKTGLVSLVIFLIYLSIVSIFLTHHRRILFCPQASHFCMVQSRQKSGKGQLSKEEIR